MGSMSAAAAGVTINQPMSVASATWQCFSLPLHKPVTTGPTTGYRRGLMLQIELQKGDHSVHGLGEVAPLPGDASRYFFGQT